MITVPTAYPTFYNQTIIEYKNNIWNSVQFEIIISIAAIIVMLFISVSIIEKILSWRESLRLRELLRKQIIPIV